METDAGRVKGNDRNVDADGLGSALERSILHGLACEWEHAAWRLAEKYRLRLKKPLFRLADMKNRLGYWSDTHGEIVLAKDLVLNHPWDSVREVLYHEMAHQTAMQALLSNGGEPPHGPVFHEACRLLHANPKASGRYETLHERLARTTLNAEDRLLVRIRKLMALAGSHNRHEAEAAMSKAHDLMRKHHVTELAQKTRRDFVSVFVGKPALRHFREAYALAHLLQDFYYVQGLWVEAYVVDRARMGRVLEISGTARNVRVAGYVHDYVSRFIDREWKAYRQAQHRTLGRYRKTDFALGVIRGFRSKLQAHEEGRRGSATSTALVEIRDVQLDTYMRRRYPSVRTIRHQSVRQDGSVHQDGIRRGKRLVIAEGIALQDGERGKYLP